MIVTIPRRFVLILTSAIAIHAGLSASLTIATTPAATLCAPALAIFAAAFLLLTVGVRDGQAALWKTVAGTAAAIALPLLASLGLDRDRATFTSGGWFVEAVSTLVILLLWRHREPFAWIAMTALVLGASGFGGLHSLNALAIFAAVLLVTLVAAGGWSLRHAAKVLTAHAEVEQRNLAFWAAQEAFHSERQMRLATTTRLGDAMLQRIVESGGRLEPADRAECRILEQTIRDEIRGRRLLNDALRDQVLTHRRNGSVVQVNDDGGLDDLEPDQIDPMLNRIAEAITGLQSDRIVIRTAPQHSTKAITVVATSTDPIAGALGLDDDVDHIDLWLELDRPALTHAS